MKKKQIQFPFLIIIFCLAFFLRFYKLGEIPPGLSQDETAIGYNAFSILKTNKDEYGNLFPLYFKSFGEYKLPVYIYTAAIAIKSFGLNSFSVRFPAALFGSLTVLLVYYLVNELFINELKKENKLVNSLTRNKLIALTASFLLAINPWHLHYSRAAFEVTLALFFSVLGWVLLQESLKKRNSLFFPGVLVLLLSVYTYNISRLLAPILLLGFGYFYRTELKKLPKLLIFSTLLAVVILLIPFLVNFFSVGGLPSTKGTLIFSSPTIRAKGLELRSYLISFLPFYSKLFFNRWFFSFWQYLNNLISYFSVSFLFLFGSSHGNHGIGNFGQLYPFELLLLIIAIFQISNQRKKRFYPLGFWFLATVGVASLTREAPHANRALFLTLPFAAFSAYGLFTFLIWLRSLKLSKRVAVGLIFIGLVVYSLVFYFTSYYVRFPIFYARSWRAADEALALYLKQNSPDYEKIIIDDSAGFIYTSLLFYQAYSPDEFQTSVVRAPDDAEGFSKVKNFGKYEFRDIDWQKDYPCDKCLLITKSLETLPDNVEPIKTFFYPTRPVVLTVKGEIFNYPVTEVAYVAVSTTSE